MQDVAAYQVFAKQQLGVDLNNIELDFNKVSQILFQAYCDNSSCFNLIMLCFILTKDSVFLVAYLTMKQLCSYICLLNYI